LRARKALIEFWVTLRMRRPFFVWCGIIITDHFLTVKAWEREVRLRPPQ